MVFILYVTQLIVVSVLAQKMVLISIKLNQTTKQPTNQPINQSTKQSTNQPINQKINQPN